MAANYPHIGDRINDPAKLVCNINAVRQAAESMGKEVLDLPGWILYSSYKTLVRGDYYFLGVNPAGSGEDHPKTVQNSLDGLIHFTGEADKNQYLDVSWYKDPNDERRRPLQKRVDYLFKQLNVNPNDVCASNLIFASSKKGKDSGGSRRAEICWRVHEAILEIVQPRVIITHGSMPFDFVNDKLRGISLQEPQKCNHANWTWRCSRLGETGQKLVGLPHLSIYAIDTPSRAVTVLEIVKQIQWIDLVRLIRNRKATCQSAQHRWKHCKSLWNYCAEFRRGDL